MRVQGFSDLVRIDHQVARQTGYEVSAAELEFQFFFHWQRGTDLDLHGFGRLLSNEKRVLLFDIVHDRLVELITGHTQAGPGNNAAERHHGDFGRTAADVDDHVARIIINRNSRAERGKDRL